VTFAERVGPEVARKLLAEDWAPDAAEAKRIGLADEVVAHQDLLPCARALAESWIADGRRESRTRELGRLDEFAALNQHESAIVADLFFTEKYSLFSTILTL